MSRSSARGQTEPLAALVALLAVVAAVGAYATVYERTLPDPTAPTPDPTLGRVAHTLTAGGVVHPSRLARTDAPHGASLRVELRAANHTWRRGPTPPADAPAAARPVPVRVDGRVVLGRLRVVVWS